MGGWKVSSSVVEGIKIFTVYRVIDAREVDHSGNREYAGFYYNREDAHEEAERLNKKEAAKSSQKYKKILYK